MQSVGWMLGVVVAVSAAGLLFALGDSLAALRMAPAAFLFGPVVATSRRAASPATPVSQPGKYSTATVVYRVLDSGDVVFRRKWWTFLKFAPPLDFRGVIRRCGDQFESNARLSLSLVLFFGLLTIGLSIATLGSWMSGAGWRALVVAGVAVIGVGVLGGQWTVTKRDFEDATDVVIADLIARTK